MDGLGKFPSGLERSWADFGAVWGPKMGPKIDPNRGPEGVWRDLGGPRVVLEILEGILKALGRILGRFWSRLGAQDRAENRPKTVPKRFQNLAIILTSSWTLLGIVFGANLAPKFPQDVKTAPETSFDAEARKV